LNGIIHHLAKKCGKNVHDAGIVTVTADRPFNDDSVNAAKNVADATSDTHFCSACMPNMWLCYDFMEATVTPRYYSLRSRRDLGQNSENPKSWVIEGSLDGEEWELLDQRENARELNGAGRIASFPVAKELECRFIRIRTTGPTHIGHNYLKISYFEIFGTLHH
jgi:hypothetical protein